MIKRRCVNGNSVFIIRLFLSNFPDHPSRSITYAQMEKELLAIVFDSKKFDQYVYGRDTVHVQRDHKPLEVIFTPSTETWTFACRLHGQAGENLPEYGMTGRFPSGSK